jgi:hypothetical protein
LASHTGFVEFKFSSVTKALKHLRPGYQGTEQYFPILYFQKAIAENQMPMMKKFVDCSMQRIKETNSAVAAS